MSKARLMQGNEACAEGAIAAGVRFFAGYPITPSTEVAETMAKLLPRVGGKFVQMEDEIASIGAIIGASLSGKKVLTATSGPGFSLKQENLGAAMMAEVPLVILNVMRGGPSTGLPTRPAQSDVMQARWGTHGDHPVIVLTPAFPKEIFLSTVEAFNLSERFMTPVILLLDEVIAHAHEPLAVPEPTEYEVVNRKYPEKLDSLEIYKREMGEPPIRPDFFMGLPIHIDSLEHSDYGTPTTHPEVVELHQRRRLAKVEKYKDEIIKVKTYEEEDAEILIFAYGSMARASLDAVRELRKMGIKAGLFQPLTLWPFPEKALEKAAQGKKKILVVEMNWGQMIYEVERVLKDRNIEGLLRMNGYAITPVEIINRVKELTHA